MSKTFTSQLSIPYAPWTADIQGMHANIPFDFPTFLNNLGTFCNPHVHFFNGAADEVPGSTGHSGLTMGAGGAAREIFMCQIPVSVPPWAARMLWTAGVRGFTGSISSTSVYLSPYIYTGVGGTSGSNIGAFDLTNFVNGYSVRTVSTSAADGVYVLADDSSTGFTDVRDRAILYEEGTDTNPGAKLSTFAIITITTSSSDGGAELCDFTCWFDPS